MKVIFEIDIWSKIDFKCLFVLKIVRFLRKLYYFIGFMYLGVLTLIWRPRDIKAEVNDKKSEDKKQNRLVLESKLKGSRL